MFAFLEYPHRLRQPAFTFFDRYMASVERRLARRIDEEMIDAKQIAEFESHTERNGNDIVEEHRQCVTKSDGSVHVLTRRRLGDRWYENETHTDKDGKRTSKDTWHNVADDQIDSFKQEWEKRHALKQEQPAAIQHDPTG